MFLTLAAVVAATILWIAAYSFDLSPVAYVATALSSYLFNIFSVMPIETQIVNYTLYIAYAVSLVVPILFILLGRLLRVKILKNKA